MVVVVVAVMVAVAVAVVVALVVVGGIGGGGTRMHQCSQQGLQEDLLLEAFHDIGPAVRDPYIVQCTGTHKSPGFLKTKQARRNYTNSCFLQGARLSYSCRGTGTLHGSGCLPTCHPWVRHQRFPCRCGWPNQHHGDPCTRPARPGGDLARIPWW